MGKKKGRFRELRMRITKLHLFEGNILSKDIFPKHTLELRWKKFRFTQTGLSVASILNINLNYKKLKITKYFNKIMISKKTSWCRIFFKFLALHHKLRPCKVSHKWKINWGVNLWKICLISISILRILNRILDKYIKKLRQSWFCLVYWYKDWIHVNFDVFKPGRYFTAFHQKR